GARRDRQSVRRTAAGGRARSGACRGDPRFCRRAPRLVPGAARDRLCRRTAADRHRQDHPPRPPRPPMTVGRLLGTLAFVAIVSGALAAFPERSWATLYKLAISQVAE